MNAHPSRDAGIYRYLIRYGACGRVGRFGAIHEIDCRRGDRVVVHTDRGIEPGEVLVTSSELSPGDQQPPAGEVLRTLTSEDERVLNALQVRQTAIVRRCRSRLQEMGLAVEIVEAESLLDARTTVLYFLGESSEELGRLAVELASDPRERVRFEPLLLNADETVDDGKRDNEALDEQLADGVNPMKGPYERLKYDFRRLWECPVCKRRERTEGSVTFVQCTCTQKGEEGRSISMRMVEDGPRTRFPSRPRWPRLPEEIAASEVLSQSQPELSAVKLPVAPTVLPPAEPPGPPSDISPTA